MPGSADFVQRFVHALEAGGADACGSQNTLKDNLKGDYRDRSTVILRSLDLQKYSLKWATLLGLENECVFFSDHDRQQINTGK